MQSLVEFDASAGWLLDAILNILVVLNIELHKEVDYVKYWSKAQVFDIYPKFCFYEVDIGQFYLVYFIREECTCCNIEREEIDQDRFDTSDS